MGPKQEEASLHTSIFLIQINSIEHYKKLKTRIYKYLNTTLNATICDKFVDDPC